MSQSRHSLGSCLDGEEAVLDTIAIGHYPGSQDHPARQPNGVLLWARCNNGERPWLLRRLAWYLGHIRPEVRLNFIVQQQQNHGLEFGA
jgi:hypothetical protein